MRLVLAGAGLLDICEGTTLAMLALTCEGATLETLGCIIIGWGLEIYDGAAALLLAWLPPPIMSRKEGWEADSWFSFCS